MPVAKSFFKLSKILPKEETMYYFGFVPSDELYHNIQHVYQCIENQSNESLTPYRDKIVRLTSQELLNAMLIQLINGMPDNLERKQRLIALSKHIETTTDKLIGTILMPADNHEILPSFEFFDHNVMKYDKNQMKLCFPLSDRLASEFFDCFDNIQQGNGKAEVERLSQIFAELSHACLQHFLLDFTKTLPLNKFKRGAIVLANGVLEKAITVALNHLIPQLPQASLERFITHYHAQIFRL